MTLTPNNNNPNSRSANSTNTSSNHSNPPPPALLPPDAAPANVLPGGTAHTADPNAPPSSKLRSQDYSIIDAAKTIKLSDYKTIHTKPCVRDALMTGIIASVGIGGAGAVMGRPLSRAANWAVFTFCASSFASYQYCLTNRQLEREGMKRAVEVMERRKGDDRRKAVGKVVDGEDREGSHS